MQSPWSGLDAQFQFVVIHTYKLMWLKLDFCANCLRPESDPYLQKKNVDVNQQCIVYKNKNGCLYALDQFQSLFSNGSQSCCHKIITRQKKKANKKKAQL